MPLTTEFDTALAGLLAAWRDHHTLKSMGADISTLAAASAALDQARSGVISARRHLIS
jgi:hypothetical protein